jgi:adenosine deaminase
MKGTFHIFGLIHNVINDKASLTRLTHEVLEDFAHDNVMYLELRTTPKRTKDLGLEEYLHTVLEIIKDHNKTRSMQVRLITSVNRSEPIDKGREILDLALKLRDKYSDLLVGLDYSGNPYKGDFSLFEDLFSEARRVGLNTCVHCAELPDHKTSLETTRVLDFEPDRLGHFNYYNDEQLRRVHTLGIPIEMCPTSNMFTMMFDVYIDHHFIHFYRRGHKVALCTDDTGVFDMQLSEELYNIMNAFGLGSKDAVRVVENSIEMSFAPDELKNSLRTKLKNFVSNSLLSP